MPNSPLVTLAQAAERLVGTGISYCAIKRYRDDGRFKKAGVGTNGSRATQAYLYDFEEIKRVASEFLVVRRRHIPDGWIDIGEACQILRVSYPTMAWYAQSGRYEAKKVDFGIIRKKWVFRRDLVEVDTPTAPAAPKLAVDTEPNYLICARHEWCLHARREMFERAGRRINFEKLLAIGKRVG